jgi:hypothetical protein
MITVKPKDGEPYDRSFTLAEDLERLEATIKRIHAKLVIIDPLMAIVGNKDPYRDNEVRALLAPLVSMMERHHCACLMIRHLTKGGSGDALVYRGGGSIGIVGVARSALMIQRDPHDEQRCVLAHIKANVGKYAPALTFTIASDEGTKDAHPYVVWGEAVNLSFRDLQAPPTANKPSTGRDEILRVLQEHYPEEMSLQDIAKELPDITYGNLKMTLKRMVDERQIEKAASRGRYVGIPVSS